MIYDVSIIGGGPGGYSAAIRAAQLGGKVALVEKEWLGGTCLNYGCIPTKNLYAGAELLRKFNESENYGIKVDNVSFDFAEALRRKDEVVEHLRNGLHKLFKTHKIDIFEGKGSIEKQGFVRVDSPSGVKLLETKNIIIATGSEAADIPPLRIDGRNVIGNREILNLPELPQSLIIVGGGVIGCEFANIFSRMGIRVTIIEQLDNILPDCEREISRLIKKRFIERGIDILTGQSVIESEINDENVTITLDDGNSLSTEKVLVAVGRRLNSFNLNLEEVGVEMENCSIKVNEKMETTASGIYAVGDITGKWTLAHVAAQEGKVAVANIMNHNAIMDYSSVPSVVFTHPEIAQVGKGEKELKEEGIAYKVGRFPYIANGKALSMREEDGFVKVLLSKEDGKALGVHIFGAHASDLIAEATLAMKKECTFEEVVDTIHAHPTLSETLLEAWEDAEGMAIHKAGRRI